MDINVWTIPGAAAAAIILTQFAKQAFKNLNARLFSLSTGAVVFLVSVLLTAEEVSPIFVIGAIIGAAQAGLSSTAGYDSATSGLDYQVKEAPKP